MKITTPGKRGFLMWVRQNLPQLYATLARKHPELVGVTRMEGFGLLTASPTITTAPASPTWITQITELAKVYLTTRTQKKLWDLQMEQAKRGQPPLDLSAYQPGIDVDVGTRTQKMLMLGAGLLAAVFILPRLFKR